MLNCVSNCDSISIHNLSAELLALPVSGVVVVAGIYLHRARCMSACFYAAAPLAHMHLQARIFRNCLLTFAVFCGCLCQTSEQVIKMKKEEREGRFHL